MKRKTSTSLFNLSDSMKRCAVSPNIINNIVYISNLNRAEMAEFNVSVGIADMLISAEGGEMVLGRFAKEAKIGDVVLGVS